MKKTLLLTAALVASLGASAQGEKAYFATAISGLSTTATAVAAGTPCGSTSLADATIGADDNYKLVSVNGPKTSDGTASYKKVTFDGATSLIESEPGLEQGGIQGAANPKDEDGGSPSSTLKVPTSGAFFQFKAKGDGYLYVVAKMSSNKAYTVFEEGAAIPYFYSQGTDAAALPNPLSFDLAGTGTYDAEAGAEYITTADHPNGIFWPEQIALNWNGTDEWTKIGNNGVGVIGFPIVSGLTYVVNAVGSKISGLGFYTSTTKPTSITLSTEDDANTINLLASSSDGINTINANDSKAEFNALDPIYNLAGQRVTGAYKGVVIQNGHKYILNK